jgi:DNA anti-recombination protein RmuC
VNDSLDKDRRTLLTGIEVQLETHLQKSFRRGGRELNAFKKGNTAEAQGAMQRQVGAEKHALNGWLESRISSPFPTASANSRHACFRKV